MKHICLRAAWPVSLQTQIAGSKSTPTTDGSPQDCTLTVNPGGGHTVTIILGRL